MTMRLVIPRVPAHPGAAVWLPFFGRPSGPIGWVGARVMPFVSRRLSELMATELRLHPEDDLLDVGCGSGVFLEHAAPRVRFVAGLDASTIQFGMARGRLHDRIDAGRAELVMGDAEALPWEDGRFSAVASLNCLKFVADPDRALAEMCRVLRPGGRIAVLVDPEVPASRSGTVDRFGQRQWSAHDAKLMMDKAGFVDISVRQLPAKYYRLQLVCASKPT